MTAVTTANRVTARRVLHSEWTKLWSLRSTWVTLAAFAGLTVAFGALLGAGYEADQDASSDPVQYAMYGVNVTELVVVVLGISLATGEYTSGTIRATFAAVPRRVPVLWAKAGAFGALVLAVALVTVFSTFSLAQAFLSDTDLASSLGDPGVVAALVGSAVRLTLVAVFGLTLGALLRSLPAAIGTYVGASLGLSGLANLLPGRLGDASGRYVPESAGDALMSVSRDADQLPRWAAFAVLCGWLASALAAAAMRTVRHDA